MRMAIVAAGLAVLACGSEDGDNKDRRRAPPKPEPARVKGPCPAGTEPYRREVTGTPTVTGCRLPSGEFQGKYAVEYPDGTKTAEGSFERGQRHGAWIFRHANGKTWKQGSYVHGKLDGEWKEFSEAGTLLGSYSMRAGTGTEVQWFDDGAKRLEVAWRDGLRNGLTVWWFETGEKMMEATYEDGRLHGPWTFWDVKGQTRKIETWKLGIIESTVWYENGVPLTD